MPYCKFCGNEVEDGALFCGNCGQSLESAAQAPQRRTAASKRQLHCPECGSTAISPVVETEISGGTSVNHSFTRKTSASQMTFNNTHRNYWMCSNCGNKFRNLQNLEEEIQSLRKKTKSGTIGAILLAVLAIIYGMFIGMGLAMMLVVVDLIVVVCICVVNGRIKNMEQERAYLKANCFG